MYHLSIGANLYVEEPLQERVFVDSQKPSAVHLLRYFFMR